MIGNIATVVMNFIVSVLMSLWNFLYQAIQNLFRLLYELFVWLGQLLQRLFQALIDVLVSFFMVIYDLIRGLMYLIYMIGVLAVKLFFVLFELAKLLWAFVQGLARTIGSIFYIPLDDSGHGYSEMMGRIVGAMDVLQLDVVAYILLFLIWIATAFGVMSIIGTLKNL